MFLVMPEILTSVLNQILFYYYIDWNHNPLSQTALVF